MTNGSDACSDAKRTGFAAEWWLAAAGTLVILLVHLYFLNSIGGLWRDEVNSLNVAQGPLQNITHDSFPALFPFLLRLRTSLGAQSDIELRVFGILMGLLLTGAFWLAAWWTRRAPPLWSLALVALNAWVIYYASSLRAYGLGSAMIVFCCAASWRFIQFPNWKTWSLFTLASVLSVQTLYQNPVLVAAICAGACAVALRKKNFRLALAVFFAGLTAAISLLPYWNNLAGISGATMTYRMGFDRVQAMNNLDTLLAYPMPQFAWIWIALAAFVIVRGLNEFFKETSGLTLFAAVTLAVAVGGYWTFLWVAQFPMRPWYFLPPTALAVVCIEMSLPRPRGKFRVPVWAALAGIMAMSGIYSLHVLKHRFTNVDQLAKKVSALAQKSDFVLVTAWPAGLTFAHYFNGDCPWETIPPLADHNTHRYDLVQSAMQNPDTMAPVLAKISATLQSGGTVWVVGELAATKGTNEQAWPGPPPLRRTGWAEAPYFIFWNVQAGDCLLRSPGVRVEMVDPGTNADVNPFECLPLFKVTTGKTDRFAEKIILKP